MRLFLAIWPDGAAAAALAGLAQGLAEQAGGRAVPAHKIHLTLAFLGELADGRLAEVATAAAGMRWRPFDLMFDTLGWFRGARVGWIGCSEVAPELARLQSALAESLRDRGFALDERPYTPHITLVRKIGRPVPRAGTAPIRWRAGELALVRSESGTGRYTTIEAWKARADKSP